MAGLGTIALITGVLGTAVSAAGTLAGGQQASAAAEFEAKQREQQAMEARAISGREALERRKEQRLLASQVQAQAAKTGGGSDPSILTIFQDIAETGELNVQTELYKGEQRARGFEAAADVARFEGRRAKTASYIGAGSGLLSGASTLYTRHGLASRQSVLPKPASTEQYTYGLY